MVIVHTVSEINDRRSCQARLVGDTVGDRDVVSTVVEGLEALQIQAAPAQTLMMGLPQGSERA